MCTIAVAIASFEPEICMRQFPRAVLLSLAALFAALPAVARPRNPRDGAAAPVSRRWGPVGHRIVAELAQNRLSMTAQAEVARLLGGQHMTDVASWADDIRRDQPATGPWHYIDIEVTDSSYVPARDCKESACIIDAFNSQLSILADHSRSDADRAVALKWVVHLTGDVHQPLHAGERGDRGGNDVKVTFQGKQTNLHSLWDSGLLLSYGIDEPGLIRVLEDSLHHRSDLAAIASGSITQWAMESHDIARDVLYRNIPANYEIGDAYAAMARPVIYDRLERAGVRLAAVLNRALGD